MLGKYSSFVEVGVRRVPWSPSILGWFSASWTNRFVRPRCWACEGADANPQGMCISFLNLKMPDRKSVV